MSDGYFFFAAGVEGLDSLVLPLDEEDALPLVDAAGVLPEVDPLEELEDDEEEESLLAAFL